MNFKKIFAILILALIVTIAYSQPIRDDINGDWSDQQVTLYNTPEAAVMVRVGDIDNLGFGWPTNFDPFSGLSTPSHAYPFSPEPDDVDGTDRIMVVTSYNGTPPFGQDGYTNNTTRPENLPRPILMNYNLGGATVSSAVLQIFVDDFQAPVWHANYVVKINNLEAPYLSAQINSLVQTGPIGKLINVAIPQSQLYLVNAGSLSILFDDLTTGAGDGYAIDFVKLLVNPTAFTYTGTITGAVTAEGTGTPISGAVVSASGLVETSTDGQGNYTLNNVAAGLINITVTAPGYQSHSGFVNLENGQTVTYNIQLQIAITPECDTLHYPLAGTPLLFFVIDNGGYVCGNNLYGDRAKADYFNPQETGKQISKGLFEFGYVTKGSGQNPNIEFRIWNNQGAGGKPGNILGTTAIPLSRIFNDVNSGLMTEVIFDPPVDITGPFYLGVMLPTTTGDTIALVSTDNGEVNPGIAWEMWYDNKWYPFNHDSSWLMNLGQAIYAVYCDQGFGVGEESAAPALQIFPNPAKDILHIQIESREEVTISILGFLGQRIGTWSFADASEMITLPVDGLSPGMYLVTITGKDFRVSRKIMVQ